MNTLRVRSFLGRHHIMVAALLIGCYWLCGCAAPWNHANVAPLTAKDATMAQAVADAQAGLDAFAQAPGVTYDENAGKILAGVQQFNKAAAGQLQIPAPRMSPSAILANPDAYHSAAVTAREKAEGVWGWVKLASALGMLTTIGVAAGRFLPGVGPFIQPIASILGKIHWMGLSSEDEKQAERDQAEIAGHVSTVAGLVREIAPDYRKLPPAAIAAIEAVLAKAPKAA